MPRARTALLATVAALSAALPGCTVVDTRTTRESESRLKVAHAGGETIVPARAERIVALEPDALETALALGVPPLGAASVERDGSLPDHLGERARDVEVVGRAWDVDLAALRALGPDLILGSKRRHGRLYPRLAQIAPTVLTEDTGAAWKLNLRLYAEAMNRPDAGERLLLDYDRRTARLERRLGPTRTGLDVSLVRAVPGQIRAYARDSFAGSVLADAELGRPPAQSRPEVFLAVPPSRIPSLDGDVLLLSRAEGGGPALRELLARPAWSRLRVVRRGRVHRVADDPWMVGQGILSARAVLGELDRLVGS